MQRWMLLLCTLFALSVPLRAQEATEEPPPEPMPLVDENGQNIVNVLLLGTATYNDSHNPGLTDTMMIVSVNRDSGHVAVLSVPRDLHVYIPGRGMRKLNQTYYLAERQEAGSGMDALRETITYNLGLEIDYYAMLNFDGFPALIDAVGGIDLAVDCALRDWHLIEPHLDKDDPENWELLTLWAGLYHMDGDLALWYVRSRRTSTDIDRGRRQQDVLRALWRRIRSEGLLENFPELWAQFNDLVETDLTLTDALGFLPLLSELEAASVAYFTFRINREVRNGYTEDEGRFILIPDREAIQALVQQVVAPPNSSRLAHRLPTALIYNASGIRNMHVVAAQRLEREGFLTTATDAWTQPRTYIQIIDHTGTSKNNPVARLQDVLGVTDEGVRVEPDAQREYDYEIYIGNHYQYSACTFAVIQPEYEEEATEEPEATETP